jgi:hydrogenase maturation protein HypF
MKVIAVQHHYAHLAAAMAENGLREEVLGVICDGTGWGIDGAVWGGEILRGDFRGFTRLAHLRYVPLPGGDVTAKKPYRMALAYLAQTLDDRGWELAERLLPDVSREETDLLRQQLEKGLRVLPTSSCGRLFDAVSALLGICSLNRYEGQAAIELEKAALVYESEEPYPYALEQEAEILVMDIWPMWDQLVSERLKQTPNGTMARRFHMTLVAMITEALQRLRVQTGLNQVVISGGVFHNQILLVELIKALKKLDFVTFHHLRVPPGDGGISLGQAAIGCQWADDNG